MTYLKKSPWIVHYNASSCNGCDIEILAALTPLFDVERFGIVNTGNPKHADILLVTGSINAKNIEPFKNATRKFLNQKLSWRSVYVRLPGGIPGVL